MGIIRFRCSDGLEQRFNAAATKASVTPAQLGRAVFERAFPEGKPSEPADEDGKEKAYEERSKGIFTRLTNSEYEALGKSAKSFGMGRPTFVMRLIRAHLTKRPQLGPDEVRALREATRELSYIGRNLNQVAHALNINLNARDQSSAELIVQINEKVDAIRMHVKDVLDENFNRWGV